MADDDDNLRRVLYMAAADEPTATMLAPVIVVGKHPRERTYVVPFEWAQFGQLRQQRGGGHRSDILHLLESRAPRHSADVSQFSASCD